MCTVCTYVRTLYVQYVCVNIPYIQYEHMCVLYVRMYFIYVGMYVCKVYVVCMYILCVYCEFILSQYTHIRISWISTCATVSVFLPVFRVEPRGGGLIYPPYLRVRYSSTFGVSSGAVQVCLYVCGGLVCTYMQYIRMQTVCTHVHMYMHTVDV